ncbi:ribonuclease HI [Chloroflexota bacterium]
MIDIWTDGACFVNPGPGAYAAIISNGGQRTEIVGGFKRTTNNRMEIMGAIGALETLKVSCRINIYSDSKYLVDGISKGWAKSWKAKGWVRKKKRVPNWDLWDRLLTLREKHKIKFIWIKGHNLQAENERCNELAEDKAKHQNLPVDKLYDL